MKIILEVYFMVDG